MSGLKRVRRGAGFAYRDGQGRRLREPATLERIRKLAIPPAWDDVWICPIANGHIQARGRDARRRKQYRYEPRWFEMRSATKFHRMIDFAASLPRIRAACDRDMRRRELSRDKVLATLDVNGYIRGVAGKDFTAKALGNTPSVCKRSYVHPAVVDSYLRGSLASTRARGDEAFVRALAREGRLSKTPFCPSSATRRAPTRRRSS